MTGHNPPVNTIGDTWVDLWAADLGPIKAGYCDIYGRLQRLESQPDRSLVSWLTVGPLTRPFGGGNPGFLLVNLALPGDCWRGHVFAPDGHLDPGYVSEKLGFGRHTNVGRHRAATATLAIIGAMQASDLTRTTHNRETLHRWVNP